LGICRFNHNHALVFDNLGFDLLLLSGFQSPLVMGLLAHALNRFHDVALLRQKGVTEIRRPLNFVSQPLDQFGKTSQRLNAGIPRLFGHRIGKLFVLQTLVFF
jgi:hypothetical protein